MTQAQSPRLDGHAGRPHFGTMPSLEREITDFDTDVLRRSRECLVIAEFWAPWCAACRRLHPALEHIAARLTGRMELVSVNIEMHAQVLAAQRVHGLPLLKGYYKGVALGELTGVLPEAAIRRWIDSLFDAARQGGLMPPPAAVAGLPTKPQAS